MAKNQPVYAGTLAESCLLKTLFTKPLIKKVGDEEQPLTSAEIITKLQQHINGNLAALMLHYGIQFDPISETGCITRDKLIALEEKHEQHSVRWKELVAKRLDHEDNCNACRSLLSEKCNQFSLSSSTQKMLIAVAQEHVPALKAPKIPVVESGINHYMIVWLWTINGLTKEPFDQILKQIQDETFQPRGKVLRVCYKEAKTLIALIQKRNKPGRQSVTTSVVTRGSKEKGTEQDTGYNAWSKLLALMSKEEPALDSRDAHLSKKGTRKKPSLDVYITNKAIAAATSILTVWFKVLIETAWERSAYIEYEYRRQYAEMNALPFNEKPPDTCWCVPDLGYVFVRKDKRLVVQSLRRVVQSLPSKRPIDKDKAPVHATA